MLNGIFGHEPFIFVSKSSLYFEMFQKNAITIIPWLKNANVTNRIHETKSHFDDVEPMARHEIFRFVT